MLGILFLWFFLFFSFFSFCWFGSGFYRFHDVGPNRIIILRPTNRPVGLNGLEGGYYVPAEAFDACFPESYAATRQFHRDNAAAAAAAGPASANTSTSAPDAPKPEPPTYAP